ncbi:hypothetical protein B0H21DRAFT_689433 [Amylocystis lapponica]|nr:hypothetical protein B0H21DRAFT_689433 [Amylocystis lapponica]
MGNSSSRRSVATANAIDSISKPKSLAATDGAPTRRSSARVPHPGSSTNLLGAPASHVHRRSRSALASSAPSRDSAPPPYSAAADPGSVAVAVAVPVSAPAALLGGVSEPPPRRASAYLPDTAAAAVADAAFAARAESLRRPLRQNSVENALDALRRYNTVILVDDSGSMEGARWLEARETLAALADIAARYDADGIDVCFLNSRKVGTNMKNADLVRRLFDSVRPAGITPIGEKLESLLLYYLAGLEQAKARYDAGDSRALRSVKPVNYIVITDGAPTDDPEEVIVTAARRLDAHNFPLSQVGIQFVQIGNNPEATAFLNELDNELSQAYGIRDMVDTTPYTGGQLTADMIIKILLGGINRRVDRRGGQSVI